VASIYHGELSGQGPSLFAKQMVRASA
jgi:hypothetical protein